MALVIYSNGIIEELVSLETTFSDDELVKALEPCVLIKSFRLSEIPNTWCLWSENAQQVSEEFNRLASEMVNDDVYSHIILLHDSELNRDWGVADDIIYKSYEEFMKQSGDYINEVANKLAQEAHEEYEAKDTASMIFLNTIGHTKDKRVMFAFNPNEQNDTFYVDGGWDIFTNKIFEYLKVNFDNEQLELGKPFVIFSDTKTIVIIEDQYVDQVVNEMLKRFESIEDYEKCSMLSEIKDKWDKREELKEKLKEEILDASVGPIKKKRGRPRKK